MWQKLQRIPGGGMWKKLMASLVVFGVGVLAFCWGRHGALSMAKANPPTDPVLQDSVVSASHSDYDKRPVAFIYNNMPISRADLGEYLIARFGEQRLDFLINHRIIDMACKAKNIVITEQMVMVELQQSIKSFGTDKVAVFEAQILRPRGKTLYEWKEDVIHPKLALRELAKPRVQVTEKDLRDAFEAHYGEMVKCRMILLPAGIDQARKSSILAKVKADEKEFLNEAQHQFLQPLCEKGGLIPPIHHHFADENIERYAFSLKVGEVSGFIELPDKTIAILRCEERIAPQGFKIYENERNALYGEVYEMKLQQEIPKMFDQMRKEARVNNLMTPSRNDLASQVQSEIQPVSGVGNPPPLKPAVPSKK
jgi:hypothetical protein